jgi:hypothetical protein
MELKMDDLPDYLTQTADGDYDIKLRRPIMIDGAKVGALRMREPLISDQLVMEATKGTDAEKEMALFANLCGISKDDIKTMGQHDYLRVQKAYANFII